MFIILYNLRHCNSYQEQGIQKLSGIVYLLPDEQVAKYAE